MKSKHVTVGAEVGEGRESAAPLSAPTSATGVGPETFGCFPGAWDPKCWLLLSSWGVDLRFQTPLLKHRPLYPPNDLVICPSLAPRDGNSWA